MYWHCKDCYKAARGPPKWETFFMMIDISLSLYSPWRAKNPFLETLQISEPVLHRALVFKPDEQLAIDDRPAREGKLRVNIWQVEFITFVRGHGAGCCILTVFTESNQLWHKLQNKYFFPLVDKKLLIKKAKMRLPHKPYYMFGINYIYCINKHY